MVVDEAHFIKNKESQRSQATCWRSPTSIRRRTVEPAAHGPHRHPAHQPDRGLPDDLAVPRLDRRARSRSPALMEAARGHRADPRRPRVLRRGPRAGRRHGHRAPARRWTSRPTSPPAASPTSRSSSTARPAGVDPRGAERALVARLVERYQPPCAAAASGQRPRATSSAWSPRAELEESRRPAATRATTCSPWCGASARPRPAPAADYTVQPGPQRAARSCSSRSTST